MIKLLSKRSLPYDICAVIENLFTFKSAFNLRGIVFVCLVSQERFLGYLNILPSVERRKSLFGCQFGAGTSRLSTQAGSVHVTLLQHLTCSSQLCLEERFAKSPTNTQTNKQKHFNLVNCY